MSFFLPGLNRRSVVFDVGAFRGNWSEQALLGLRIRSGNLHMFEPMQCLYKKLLASKRFVGCHINNVAVSDSCGRARIYFKDGVLQSSTIDRSLALKGRYVRVKTTTIDKYMKKKGIEKVDLIKLNCEGAEYRILNEGAEFIDRVQYLYVSFHGKRGLDTPETVLKRREICSMLRKRGLLDIDRSGDISDTSEHFNVFWKKDD